MKMNTSLKYGIAEGYARKVCDGEMTLLQVEHSLSRLGMIGHERDSMMQKIRDKISERKKGNGKAD